MVGVCFLRTSTFFSAIRTVQTTSLRTLSTMANPIVHFVVSYRDGGKDVEIGVRKFLTLSLFLYLHFSKRIISF
jgi:hypothetical protein